MALMERNIYKRKDGRFEARLIVGYDVQGKAIYKSLYGKSYAQAKEKLDKAKKELKTTTISKNRRQTVIEQLEGYLQKKKISIKEQTLCVYRMYLDKHIFPYFGKLRCSKLNIDNMQSFIDYLTNKGLSESSIRAIFSFLKSGLRNVFMFDHTEITLPKANDSKAVALTRDEQHRLEEAATASDVTDSSIVTLCLYTGLRIGEVCGLKWEDIDFCGKSLIVRRTVQRIKNDDKSGNESKTKVKCLSLKSKSSQRIIPLPDVLIKLLAEHRNRSNTVSPFVFSFYGKFIEPRALQYRFNNLLVAANINNGNFHMMRHTFSVRSLESGFDIKTLSDLLGHSSAAITLKYYTHAMDNNKRQCMELLADTIYKNFEHGQNSGQNISKT